MPTLNAVEIVEAFWAEVWQPPQNPDAVDDFVSEDFTITSGGVDIVSRAAFKAWIIAFQSTISGLEFDIIESFQNADGSRVASRFRKLDHVYQTLTTGDWVITVPSSTSVKSGSPVSA